MDPESFSFAWALKAQHHPCRRSRRHSEPVLRAWPIQQLRDGFRADLPLDVHVTFVTIASDNHVVYHLTVTSAVTKRSWTVSYRYSEFCSFRAMLETIWTCQASDCKGSCDAIRDCCSECFPRKRLISSSSSHAIEERKQKLESVLLHLIRTVMLPGNALKCETARANLPTHLFRFLRVKNPLDRRSALQMYVDRMQGMLQSNAMPVLYPEQCGRLSASSTASTVSNDDESPCVVCLNATETAPQAEYCCAHQTESTTILPCHHAFHRECIFEWLLFEFRCPLCRTPVGPKTGTSFCCPRSQVQWWLGDFRDYAGKH